MTRHFVKEYEAHMAMCNHLFDNEKAVSYAVGDDYENTGRTLAQTLVQHGLSDGMSLFDLGCGSGRLSTFVHEYVKITNYLGTDILQQLLDYAQLRAPQGYRFILHHELNVPAADNEFDFAVAASVFTHLQQAETFWYLSDIFRVLKPGGKLFFTYLDMRVQEGIWSATLGTTKRHEDYVLNEFLDPNQILYMQKQIGYSECNFISQDKHSIMQSVAVLIK